MNLTTLPSPILLFPSLFNSPHPRWTKRQKAHSHPSEYPPTVPAERMGSEPLCLAAMRQTWLMTEVRFPSGRYSAVAWLGWRARALGTTETTDPCRCWAMSGALYFQPMVPKPRGLLLTDSVLFRSSKEEKVQWVLWDSVLLLFFPLPSGVATNSNCHSGYHKHQSSFWLPQTPIVILVTTNTNCHAGYSASVMCYQ